MIPLNAFVTLMNAQEVANVIQAFYAEAGTTQYFKLEYTSSDGVHQDDMWVRPHLRHSPITLANHDQIVRCESRTGSVVDIIVPAVNREYVPAIVIVST